MPARPPLDFTRALTPFSATDAANSPPATRPIHWGDTPGRALVLPAESPRALYAVTRNWQGQQVPLDAQNEAAAGKAPKLAPEARPKPAPAIGGTGMEMSARYLGQGSLCVRSSVTGRHYRFTGHGHTLRIDKHDQMLMRRISDIELV
jgi:hypothetical protein